MGYDFSIRSPLKKREAGTPAEVRPVIVSGIITGSLREYSFLLFFKWRVNGHTSSLRKHPFLFALRRWGRFARNVPGGEEHGETDVFAGYHTSGFRLRETFGYQVAIGVCIAVLSLQFS